MVVEYPLQVAIKAEQQIQVGNNKLLLLVDNHSAVEDFQQVIIRLRPPTGIEVQPTSIKLSPFPANSKQLVEFRLHARHVGIYEINVHINSFPAPEQGFLNTALQVEVLQQTENLLPLEAETLFDEFLNYPVNVETDEVPDEAKTQRGDIYSSYERGLSRLLGQIKNHTRYSDALVYEQRLKENIAQSRRFGDTETRRAERSEIIEGLNGLVFSVLNMTFSELCVDIEEFSEHILKPPVSEMGQAPQSEKIFEITAIRKLLADALDDNDLIDLCLDYFPKVFKEFSEGMGNRKRRRLLIDYCERHNQLEQLVHHIQRLNPEKYEEHLSRLVKPDSR